MKPRAVHYAGALRWTRGGYTTDVGAGFAACCTGDRARHIRRDGFNTPHPAEVTCKPCLARIEWAKATADADARLPHCPKCGYTKADAIRHLDHRLCPNDSIMRDAWYPRKAAT